MQLSGTVVVVQLTAVWSLCLCSRRCRASLRGPGINFGSGLFRILLGVNFTLNIGELVGIVTGGMGLPGGAEHYSCNITGFINW